MIRTNYALLSLIATSLSIISLASAEDWTRFRGPNGSGVSAATTLPLEWSQTKQLVWETKLPGAGSSSPIVVGDKIFVTCYSGYGEESKGQDVKKLQRHLICIERTNGSILWDKTIAAQQPEDSYTGYITEHGYASSTPVSDGKSVFVFYGKSGALAYDLNGKKLWQVDLGTESSNRHWGSGASPILYKDMVIVNASDESQGIYALDKKTGKEIWKTQAAGLELCYTTPTLVKNASGSTELVVPVAGEVWGLNPDNGKLRWFCETSLTGNISPSAQVDGDVVYIFGGYRGSGSIAIRAGGKGNIAESHLLWESKETSYVASPLIHNGHLYWVDDRGQAHCLSAEDGKSVYRERLVAASGGRPVYASPVLAGNSIYYVSRWNGTYVLPAEPTFKQQAHNMLESDESDFNATPAISNNQIFLRSNESLYCIGNQ
ncbi:MAG: outer membrane protein assembly factor BamB family protein [Pirellulales bacterium]